MYCAIRPNTLGFFFCWVKNQKKDLCGALWIDPNGTYMNHYRYHEYPTGRVRWYQSELPDAKTRDEAIECINLLPLLIEVAMDAEPDIALEWVLRGPGETDAEFLSNLALRPWGHKVFPQSSDTAQ